MQLAANDVQRPNHQFEPRSTLYQHDGRQGNSTGAVAGYTLASADPNGEYFTALGNLLPGTTL